MSESEEVAALRRELGRRLAAARKDAGYAQREFAQRISYARSTLSTVESGAQRAGRTFWQASDQVLATGGQFEQGYDQIRALQDTERQQAHALARGEPGGLRAAEPGDALRAYQSLGWPAAADGRVIGLATGTVLDALAVPQTAGTLAASWWHATGGIADPIRKLPALPDPRHALAVIACAGQSYFLTAAGTFPWAGCDNARVPPGAGVPFIAWHSAGSQIPAPPGIDRDGHQATWDQLPSSPMRLPPPVLVLDLLAKALAATSHGPCTLTLASSVLVVPARR